MILPSYVPPTQLVWSTDRLTAGSIVQSHYPQAPGLSEGSTGHRFIDACELTLRLDRSDSTWTLRAFGIEIRCGTGDEYPSPWQATTLLATQWADADGDYQTGSLVAILEIEHRWTDEPDTYGVYRVVHIGPYDTEMSGYCVTVARVRTARTADEAPRLLLPA